MFQYRQEGLPLYSYSHMSRHSGLVHVITCRHGGVSGAPYRSLNLGFHVDDDSEAVRKNRSLLCRALDIDPGSLITAEQVHGVHIAVATEKERGCGALDASSRLPRTDGMVTNVRNVALTVLVADCAVIGFFDPTLQAIGIAHAGWRGTLRGIAEKAVCKMNEAFGSDPADILAAVGPSIGPCCYEVGRDVIEGFHEVYPEMEPRFFANCTKDRAHLNLWEANRWQLMEAGVREANIELAEMCTSCHTDVFYSHRRERGETGRFGGLIMLRDAPTGWTRLSDG